MELMNLKSLSKLYFNIFLALCFLTACGTFVGNPTKPNDENPKNTVQLPEINLTLPGTVSDYSDDDVVNLAGKQMLAEGAANLTGLRRFGVELDRTIKSINKVVRRLKNDDKVEREGKFFKKGRTKTMSVEVKKVVSSTSGYEYAATICDNGEVQIYLEWNSETEADFYRLIKFKNSASSTQEIVANLSISKDEQTGLQNYSHLIDGQIDSQVPSHLTPYRSAVELQMIEANKFSLSGVNTFFENSSEELILNRISFGSYGDDGEGSWAGWKNNRSGCNEIFDYENPNFCRGSYFDPIGNSVPDKVDVDPQQVGEAILADGINLVPVDKLQKIVFPHAARCPSATQ